MASPYDPQYSDIVALITQYANSYGIPPEIGIWQLWTENRFRAKGCSGAAACGIAQFIPGTAAQYGVDRNDVESSIRGWAAYMADLLKLPYINGDISLALAAYNAGPGRVKNAGGIPNITETKNYVSKVLAGANLGGSANVVDTDTILSLVTNDDSPITDNTISDNNNNYLIMGAVIFGVILLNRR